jgi:hypothetical protein
MIALFLFLLLLPVPGWAALTYTTNTATINGVDTVTSGTLSVLTGDWLDVIEVTDDNNNGDSWAVTNTGTTIAWTKQQETNIAANCKIIHWTGIAGATPPTTVSVQTLTAIGTLLGFKHLITLIHHGQHATTPLPAGNLFSIAAGNDLTQAITPTSVGSNLWLVTADWSQSNSLIAGTNNTHEFTPLDSAGAMTSSLTRPTTQPRPDTASFTLSDTDSATAGKVIGIAFEIQSAAGGGGGPSCRGALLLMGAGGC